MNHKHASQFYLLDFETYEDYLNSSITTNDLRFLRDESVCQRLISLNYRTSTDVLTADEFNKQKQLLHEQLFPTKKSAALLSAKLGSNDPVLLELAAHEIPNYQKTLSTIIFLKYRTKNGSDMSGFIDLDASLAKARLHVPGHTDWEAVFQGKAKLRPTASDLSFYNAHKGIVRHNNSDNYTVLHDVKYGLSFMHRGDHKKIFVDNTHDPIENYMRSVVYSPKYGLVIFYDHIVRKKI